MAVSWLASAGGGALRRDLKHVERLARSHEQAIALGAAETQIGAYFGQPDAADQLATGLNTSTPA